MAASATEALKDFLPPVREWFTDELGVPTLPQRLGWPAVAGGRHCLVVAPTGSGKTLTAFLWAIDRLLRDLPEDRAPEGVDVLYVSPLKALNADVERNLAFPLRGVAARDPGLPEVTVGLRSGDTSSAERQRLVRRPPNILITTPESLYLLLTSKRARPTLSHVRTVILDEVHAVCGTKRGVHLAVSLERLADLVLAAGNDDPQRIGLSATVSPFDAAARFLGGSERGGRARPVEVVDASGHRSLHLEVVGSRYGETAGVWDQIVPKLLDDIESHRSTLLFVNNRAAAEKLVARLNDQAATRWESPPAPVRSAGGAGSGALQLAIAEGELARAHHGSVSHDVRTSLEESLKEGRLPCLVATGTLELGIDMGSIDLVCQVESPKSVSRGLQRVGRSGHLVDATSKGRVYPLYRTDVAEVAALARAMRQGQIEETVVPRNCLDVLAQQVVAEVAAGERSADELFALVRRASPYAALPRRSYDAVLGMLAGESRDPDLTVSRPRIVWDRATGGFPGGRLAARPGAAQTAVVSGGTIPDRGLYPVYLAGSKVRLGELDEEFVFESKVGDAFALGSSVWRVVEIGRDRVEVAEAPGAVPRLPFWRGEGLGRPRSLGLAMGGLLRRLEAELSVLPLEGDGDDGDDGGDGRGDRGHGRDDEGHGRGDGDVVAPAASRQAAKTLLREECALDDVAASELVDLVESQVRHGAVPTDRRIVVEAFSDELGDSRVVVHSVFGARLNQAWGLALQARVRRRLGTTVEMTHADDGVMFRFPDLDGPPPVDLVRLVTSGEVDDLVVDELGQSALFASRFREAAQRALLLPRNRPGKRTPLWLQRLRAADLMTVAGRDPDFPLVLETYRECLDDVLDLDGLRSLLQSLERGDVELLPIETHTPSPFAAGMLWRFVFEYLYQGDVPKAEAQAATLSVNRDVLEELLGSDRLRELLDPEAVSEVAANVTHTAVAWRESDDEEVLDLLRRFGDLSLEELVERSAVDSHGALRRLGDRAVLVEDPLVGDRWVVADEADEYSRVLAGVTEPGCWLRRHVLGRGIVTVDDMSQRYGLDPSQVVAELVALERAGVLVSGAFTPGSTAEEWVGADTLRRMHRRTLTLLRRRTAPVDAPAFARFLREHLLVGDPGRSGPRPSGTEGLETVLELLEGVPLQRAGAEADVLAARVQGYHPSMLDALLSSGRWSWIALDPRRVAFVRPATVPLLDVPVPGDELPPDEHPGGETWDDAASDVWAHLRVGGGWRASELAVRLGRPETDVRRALDRLLWCGLVTNDSFAPARSGPARTAGGAAGATGRATASTWRRRSRARSAGSIPGAGGEGRWSTVLGAGAPLRADAPEVVADLLLRRYGVVSKEALAAEQWRPEWVHVRAALDRREAAGDVRRGYFVEGLSGVQFADPFAVEALRREADPGRHGCWVLHAADPANPWGSLVESRGVRRSAGALVVLEAGAPVVSYEGTRVTPLSDRPAAAYRPALEALADALTSRARSGRRRHVEAWGRRSLDDPALLRAFVDAGWVRTPKGVAARRGTPPPALRPSADAASGAAVGTTHGETVGDP